MGQLGGSEGQPEGSEGQPEGLVGQPEGLEGQPEGLEGQPEGSEGQQEGGMDVCTDLRNFSPFYRGHCLKSTHEAYLNDISKELRAGH